MPDGQMVIYAKSADQFTTILIRKFLRIPENSRIIRARFSYKIHEQFSKVHKRSFRPPLTVLVCLCNIVSGSSKIEQRKIGKDRVRSLKIAEDRCQITQDRARSVRIGEDRDILDKYQMHRLIILVIGTLSVIGQGP